MPSPVIRLATTADLPAINAIYNYYVPISTTMYHDVPITMAEREQWFAGRQAIHPVTVARLSEGSEEIVGWGSLQAFRAKPGYRFTVENSVYVHPDRLRGGVGSAIIVDQIQRARTLELRAIVAAIDSEQAASIAIHAKHGFQEVGRFPQIGRKFDRWLDVVFLELLLE